MKTQKQIRWNRTLLSAASLVLWCQTAGQFGLVIDQIVFPEFMDQSIYPICWMMIIGCACLLTSKQVPINQLLRPTVRSLRGLADCWPEWIMLVITFTLIGGSNISGETGIMLVCGVLCEEAVFRMMFCSYCFRKDHTLNPKTITFVSSALWSIAHMLNSLSGVPMMAVIWQCISTFGIGLVLGSIFLRTGSVWPMIIVHFAHNLVNASINRNDLSELVLLGGLDWKIKLGLTIWIVVLITWIYIQWTATERKEVEVLRGK